jgi:hypothetical protein
MISPLSRSERVAAMCRSRDCRRGRLAVTHRIARNHRMNLSAALAFLMWLRQMSPTAWGDETSGPPLRPLPPSARAVQDEDASPSPPAPDAVSLDGPPLGDAPTWVETLRAVLLTAIPDKYEDRKHWGQTTKVFDGFRVRQNGLDMNVSKRTKRVNHGAWYRYQVELLDPQRNLQLAIDHVESVNPGRYSFDLHVTTKLRSIARFEQWTLGVKGLNFPVISDAVVRMDAHCELLIRTERREGSFLPDVILEPSLRRVRLTLQDIDTHRVGEIRGDLAEELGNGSRSFIKNLLHQQEAKVVKKANAAIAKKRESLRIPASKLW